MLACGGSGRKIVLKLRKGPQTQKYFATSDLEVHSTTAVIQEFSEAPKTSNLLKLLYFACNQPIRKTLCTPNNFNSYRKARRTKWPLVIEEVKKLCIILKGNRN
jgi:hypothetical protein